MRKATRALILAAALMAAAACSATGENKQITVIEGVPVGGIGW
jgi:hypothetical protein